jgi:hypothetical protein
MDQKVVAISRLRVKGQWVARLDEHGGKLGGLNELGFQDPFATGVVEQDGVAIGFPDRRQFDAPRAVHAEEDAAGALAADEDSFGDRKSSDLQLILIAKG